MDPDAPNYEFDQDEAADEKVYAASFEDVPFETVELGSDEQLAETQAALDAERDEIDAAASEDVLDAPYGDHQAEFVELGGIALAWWREEGGKEAPISIGFNLAGDIEDYLNHLDQLVRLGFPPAGLAAPVMLDIRTGPVTLAALQFLGVFVPSLREDLRDIIKAISDSIPEANDEEEAAMDTAQAALAAERRNDMLDAFANMGLGGILAIPAPDEQQGEDEAPEEEPRFEHDAPYDASQN